MKTNKYKILVLSDSNKASGHTLKNTISLAKMIDGEIMLFSVKDPSKVIKEDNQLSAIRELNRQFTFSNKNLKKLAKSSSEKFGLNINYTLNTGRLKDEIGQFIKEYQPDIIVLGKKKRKILKLGSDKIADYIINTFSGPILVTDNSKTFTDEKSLELGVLNSLNHNTNKTLFNELLKHTKKPVKLFRIVDSKNNEESNSTKTRENTIEFVFEQNDASIKNLSKYLEINGINLLYLNRKNFGSKERQNLNAYLNNLKVPMLLSAEPIAL